MHPAQKHSEFLPDGRTRAGFFIGDGAGVGKGRAIAGVVLDSFARGRRQHVWLSCSSDLQRDAERDLRDLGVFLKVIDGPQALDRETKASGLSRDYQEGVLFCTYSSLTSATKSHGSRLDQIVAWCGGAEAFDGVLVFDECHRAKHFTPGKEGASTKVATAVIALQTALPRARVVYCSATGISEIANMAYLTRLGLWGPGSAFAASEDFMTSMSKRGLGFLEMLAMELKAEGKYVSRSLAYTNTEFLSVEAELDAAAVACYDAASALWSRLRAELTAALARTRSSGTQVWKVYWATSQRFFKLLCVSMKLPCVIAEVRAALDEGHCAVIGLQSTGEAATTQLELRPGQATPFVSVTKEMLARFVRDHFPVHIQPREADKLLEAGPSASPDAKDSKGKGAAALALPVCDESAAAKQALLDDIEELDLPGNPVDALIDALGGPSCVAEMTGRKGRIVRVRSGGTEFQARAAVGSAELDGLNITEKESFMAGKKLVAIISDAASTGISLHADARVANRRRRIHYTVELPWSADKALQQLGRSHRSNEVIGPVYKLVATPLGGERRFAAAVARRLQSLGALTRGDRRAASGLDLSDSNLDSPIGRKALRRMYEALMEGGAALPAGVALTDILGDDEDAAEAVPDIAALHAALAPCTAALGLGAGAGADDAAGGAPDAAGDKAAGAKDLGDVRRFLNRLLAMPVALQGLLYKTFAATLAAETRAAAAEGQHSEGVSDLPAADIRLDGPPVALWQPPHSTLATTATRLQLDRGVPFDSALEVLRATGHVDAEGAEYKPSSCPDGFYCSRRELYGRDMYILAVRRPGQRHLFGVTRPNTGASFFDLDREELRSKYAHCGVDPEAAREGWSSLYDATLSACMHGPGCAKAADCAVGRRLASITVLTGAVVPAWGALEAVLKRHEHTLAKSDRAMRAVRVQLCADDGGGALVGIRYPERHLDEVLARLAADAVLNATAAGPAAAAGGARVREAPRPVDAKALAKALQKPRTMHDFFSKGPSAGAGASGAAAGRTAAPAPAPGAKAKRPAAAPAPPPPAKKKPLQASPFTMNAAGAAAPARRCPICSLELRGSNAQDNEHVDACMSKRSSLEDEPAFIVIDD